MEFPLMSYDTQLTLFICRHHRSSGSGRQRGQAARLLAVELGRTSRQQLHTSHEAQRHRP